MASSSSYLLVAAIDFGTTYSGYAYSFRSSPNDIKMNANWSNGAGFQTYKTPTSVLLDKDGKFVAFGYTAEEEYENDDCQEMHLFRHFKMMLYDQKISKTLCLKSSRGKHFNAVDVFAHALRYLKDELMHSINISRGAKIHNGDIRWVITVPAIWRDDAKQFMREAALRAGCIRDKSSKELLLALEPEAASLLGRKCYEEEFDVNEDLCPGKRYILLDCGGGTNDLAIHEVLDECKVKEIQSAKGGPWGGNVVNKKFISLLQNIFGKHYIERFKNKHYYKYIDILQRFEQSKRKVQETTGSKIRVNLPQELQSVSRKPEVMINCGVSINNGVLMLQDDVVRSLFDEPVNHIVNSVAEILNSNSDISLIMMAGGFSESRWLQDAVRHEFEPRGCQVRVLEEAQLAVVKGAVLFGHSQDRVVSRKARKTYGYGCNISFDETKHDPKRKFINEISEERCSVFLPFIKVGDDISTDSVINIQLSLLKSSVKPNVIFYSMDRKPNPVVEYNDNPDLVQVACVFIDAPNPEGMKLRWMELKFSFGGTEIFLDIQDNTTGNTISTTIDFLSE